MIGTTSKRITWTRVQRNGFIAAHWFGQSDGGQQFKIEQRVRAGRRWRNVTTYLWQLPNGTARDCRDVADAKAQAEFLVS